MNETMRASLSIDAFERGAIDAAEFDHEAHVYVAWLYLGKYELAQAIDRISSALQRLATGLGVPEKYHATITWFFMLVVSERRALAPGSSWSAFRAGNPDLIRRDDNILQRYYTSDTLASVEARRRFVLPDRLAA